MTRRTRPCGQAAMLLALAAPAAFAAGTVELNFVQPERYADIGWGAVTRERNLQVLAEHVQRWGEQLPDGQRLQIDVLDIDLAGETHRVFSHPDLRVLNGRADGPRMTLRWTLSDAGGTRRTGESRLTDPGYLMIEHGLRGREMLAYDRRMLDRWLAGEVLAGTPATR